MFDAAAPIWRFKEGLGAEEDPERSRSAQSGTFLLEVFPALALATIEERFCARLKGPRYNPARRSSFRMSDWVQVLEAVALIGDAEQIVGLAQWCRDTAQRQAPTKSDQDKLDSAICALVGYQWRVAPRSRSAMVGDLATGYMITPASGTVRERLAAAARVRGVPVDGAIPD
jgi:predicted RNase H-like nuclease